MNKFIKIDENVRYNLNFIYKTEILESKVSDKVFSLGGGRTVWYVRFYSSITDKDSWESDYFNTLEEADKWLDDFLRKNAG
jgi:hypothetical protein